jgi:hypothetical protein
LTLRPAVLDHNNSATVKKIARNWKLRDEDARLLLRDVLPRLHLDAETMRAIASNERANYGLTVSGREIAANPYVIAEMYCGVDASDRISWSTVDRGVLPSPDLGGTPLADVDYNDERRFRALCVEHLRREPKHTFRFARELVIEIAERMNRLPTWKQAEFSERYFEVDAEFLSAALTLRPLEHGLAVYMKSVFEDERLVEITLRDLVSRPDIDLRRPITDSDWASWVFKADSVLALQAAPEYREATNEQADVCSRLFRRPVSVVTGPAGTGKTRSSKR